MDQGMSKNGGKTEEIGQSYDTNTWLIAQLTDGLSDDESLLQLPFPTNCLNWVVGHIIVGRDTALALLGAPAMWDEGVSAIYRSGSEPIQDGETARPFADLMRDLETSQQRISGALEQSSDKELQRIAQARRGTKPVWQHLEGLHWHETYHVGQLEILRAYALSRRTAGTNDART